MIKVRALKQFSSTVWGGVSPGDVFDMADGYLADMIRMGMVERVGDAPAAVVVHAEPAPVAHLAASDPTIAALEAALAAVPKTAPKKRGGRPRGSKNK